MLQLCPRLAKAAAQLQPEGEGAQGDSADDEDTARGMARLFIEAGETYTDILASGWMLKLAFALVLRHLSVGFCLRGEFQWRVLLIGML